MKKVIITICCLLLCLPVFAGNALQQKYEADNMQNINTGFYDFLSLINEDYEGYYNDKNSVYGCIVNLTEDYEKENRSTDLIYLKEALNLYKQAYDTQSKAHLHYIYIKDKDYQIISEKTKGAIKIYNSLYLLSQRNENDINLDDLYSELNADKQKFLSDKNNMKKNQEIELKYYKEHENIENYIKTLKTKNTDKQQIKKYQDLSNAYNNFAGEIFNYSTAYEKNKYQNWLIKNNKKVIKGALEQYVYANQYQPQIGGLYTHDPSKNLYLIVQQTVPGGVILTGSSRIGAGIYPVASIFLQTTKQFADGAMIREPLVAEYKGFYDYTTVLGARKRIYKFYRYGTNEINANFSKMPNEKFYFYGFDGKWY